MRCSIQIAWAALFAVVLAGCTGGDLRPLRTASKRYSPRPAPALAPQEPVALPGAEMLPAVEPPAARPDPGQLEKALLTKVAGWIGADEGVQFDFRDVEANLARELPGELAQEARVKLFPQLRQKLATKAVHDAVELVTQLSGKSETLTPLTRLEMAQEALRYYGQRYGISGEFRQVIAAIGPLNEIQRIRSGAKVGAGQILGLFYQPGSGRTLELPADEVFSTDGAPSLRKHAPTVRLHGKVAVHGLSGKLHRETFQAVFGSPYVVFLDRMAAENPTLLTTAVLVHELKHYLDYLRDPSATPTFAEPAELSTLRAELKRPGAEEAAWELEKTTSHFDRFMADALELAFEKTGSVDLDGPIRQKIEERYKTYFHSEWSEHLPYLLRPGEASAFLEQVRFYKHRHFHGEDRLLQNMMETPTHTPGDAVRFPMPTPVQRYFRILYRAA